MQRELAAETSLQGKRGRGLTVGKDLTRINQANRSKLTIEMSEKYNRPTDWVQLAKLSSEIRVTARKFFPVHVAHEKIDKKLFAEADKRTNVTDNYLYTNALKHCE